MVAMGGGPELLHAGGSEEKELILCVIPFPESAAKKGIEELKKEFPNVEVHYFWSKFNNGKLEPVDVPEGM